MIMENGDTKDSQTKEAKDNSGKGAEGLCAKYSRLSYQT